MLPTIASLVPVPLHGVGRQEDLVLPFPVTIAVAVAVIVASFVVLTRTSDRERSEGRPIPAFLRAMVNSTAGEWLLRLVGLLIFAWTSLAAWLGPDDALNPTAVVVFVVLWVFVLAIGSALFGPLYPALDPVRSVWLVICTALRRDPKRGLRIYPQHWGYRGAAVGILAFAWLELAAPNHDSTVTLRLFFGVLLTINLIGTVLFGTDWLDNADPLTVTSRFYGHLAVIGRSEDGSLRARLPLLSAERMTARNGIDFVVIALLAATLWDGLGEKFADMSWWQSTLGLIATAAVLYALYWLCTQRVMREHWPTCMEDPKEAFAPSLVPIALGYVVAHYWTLLIIGGQQAIIRSSDPFGVGDNLLGTGDWGISYSLIQPGFVATLKVSAVVIGHVTGVVVAHRIAARRLLSANYIRSQIPLLVLMVLITIAGLVLLFPE